MKCVGNFFVCQTATKCHNARECCAIHKALVSGHARRVQIVPDGTRFRYEFMMLPTLQIDMERVKREQQMRVRNWRRRANV